MNIKFKFRELINDNDFVVHNGSIYRENYFFLSVFFGINLDGSFLEAILEGLFLEDKGTVFSIGSILISVVCVVFFCLGFLFSPVVGFEMVWFAWDFADGFF